MPAIDELELLLFNDTVRNKVNKTIEAHNGTKLSDKGDPRWYWSSTESGKEVKMVLMDHGKISSREKSFTDSYTFTRIRAIAKFGSNSSSSSSANNYSSTSSYSSSGKVYKVGDIYDESGKKGVVFEVDATGKHGKIVSITCSNYDQNWALGAEQKRFIGAIDEYDGEKNMIIVKQQSNWRSNYPAFAWCANLGASWYLPAKNELMTIFANKKKIEPHLSRKLDVYLWSSTETDEVYKEEYCPWNASATGNMSTYCKSRTNVVFAVAKF